MGSRISSEPSGIPAPAGADVDAAAYEFPEIWDPAWFPAEDHARAREQASLVPGEVRSLLDVGCGNGLFLNGLALSARIPRLVGVDRSAAALAHVRTPRCRVNAVALPFPDGAFDMVTCMETLEHLPVPIYARAVEELGRVARRFVLITVPWRQDLDASLCRCPKCRTLFNGDYHVRSYDETSMTSLMTSHGFGVRWVRPAGAARVFADQLVISRVERWWRGHPTMPANAICPVCRYQDLDALRHELARRREIAAPTTAAPRRGVLGGLLAGVRPTTMAYRWMAALYEREARSD